MTVGRHLVDVRRIGSAPAVIPSPERHTAWTLSSDRQHAHLAEPIVHTGHLSLEPSARRICLDDHALPLTTTEYEILACLIRAAGRIVSRDDLMAAVFGREAHPVDRALDVHISHVRRKLGPHRDLVLTVRSVGHMLRVDAARSGAKQTLP